MIEITEIQARAIGSALGLLVSIGYIFFSRIDKREKNRFDEEFKNLGKNLSNEKLLVAGEKIDWSDELPASLKEKQ